MKTWRCATNSDYAPCIFRTKPDLELTGRSATHRGGEEFAVRDSEYADDTAVVFASRADVAQMTPRLLHHFDRWGMEVHVGSASNTTSKSEVLFCAAARASYASPKTYDGADLSDIRMPGGLFMPVVDSFKYLGSYLSRDCSDDIDVDNRIESAGKAFGALRKCLFSSRSISPAAKRCVYTGVILSILLYGCECWSLTEVLYDRLRLFHAQCMRVMARVSRKATWRRHITTEKLGMELGLHPIDYYISRRQLTWLGHVSRMDFNRLPRRMLSSWVNHKRPKGSPNMTYGRSVNKALGKFDIHGSWRTIVHDRDAWRHAMEPGSFTGKWTKRKRGPRSSYTAAPTPFTPFAETVTLPSTQHHSTAPLTLPIQHTT